jgi:hypothetical protein
MHYWGDEGVDWEAINNAAYEIAMELRKWRIGVRDWKEKYGTVRVYCSLGWYQLHDITHPGHCFSRYPKWLWKLDCRYFRKAFKYLNRFIVPIHKRIYRRAYKDAVVKYPHIKEEILCCADWDDLLEGL